MRRGTGRAVLASWIAIAALGSTSAARADDTSAPGCTVKLARVSPQNVPTFRSECVWSIAPMWVSAALTDPQDGHKSSLLKSSERLADGRIVNVQKTGWPFEDRQSTITQNDDPLPGGGVRRSYHLASQQAPLADGAVQVGVDEGLWEIGPHADGSHVVFELTYEPGGNLPTRIVQTMSPKYIAKGLDELRVSAEKIARTKSATPNVASGPPTQ